MDYKEFKKIPNGLRKYRKVNGLKQNQVAAILGTSSGRLSKWEKGTALPNLVNLIKLSIVYQTLMDALYFDQMKELRKEIFENRRNTLKG